MPDIDQPSARSKQGEETVTVPKFEWDEARKKIAMSEMEQLVVSRVKTHFAWIAVVVAVLGLIGVNAIAFLVINQQVEPQLTKVREATAKVNAKAEIATQSIEKMNVAVKEAKAGAELALSSAERQQRKVERMLAAVNKRADEAVKAMNTAAKLADLSAAETKKKTLKQQIEVGALLGELSERADALNVRYEGIQSASENVRIQLETSVTEITKRLDSLANKVPEAGPEQARLALNASSRLKLFKENSEYTMFFSIQPETNTVEANRLLKYFQNIGFKASKSKTKIEKGVAAHDTVINVYYNPRDKEKSIEVTEILSRDSVYTSIGIKATKMEPGVMFIAFPET